MPTNLFVTGKIQPRSQGFCGKICFHDLRPQRNNNQETLHSYLAQVQTSIITDNSTKVPPVKHEIKNMLSWKKSFFGTTAHKCVAIVVSVDISVVVVFAVVVVVVVVVVVFSTIFVVCLVFIFFRKITTEFVMSGIKCFGFFSFFMFSEDIARS